MYGLNKCMLFMCHGTTHCVKGISAAQAHSVKLLMDKDRTMTLRTIL